MFMNSTQNACSPCAWGTKKLVVGELYEFNEIVSAPSSSIISKKEFEKSKKICLDESEIRNFKTARLFQINEEHNKVFFVGHKVPNSGCKKSNRKYLFSLPFDNGISE